MAYAKTRIAASVLAMATIIAATPANAAGVAAGTIIRNTASATFDDGTGTVSVDSNEVEVQVDELLDVTVASQDAAPVPLDPDTAVLTYEITNTGNGPEAYTLTANPTVTGNDFDTTIDAIAYDTNENGVYGDGDDVIPAGGATPLISADDTLTIFVIVSSPNAQNDGDTSQVNLLAEAVTGTGAPGTTFEGQGVDGSDAVVGATNADGDDDGTVVYNVVAPPTVSLVKSAVVSNVYGSDEAIPGATITYTLIASVGGTGTVTGLTIADTIPTGTTYSDGSLTLDSNALTDADDTDAGEAGTSGVSVVIPSASAGDSHTVTFDVTVNAGA